MSALTEFLFPAPAKRSAGAILKWWEKRRLPFNLAVGLTGVVSVGVASIVAALPPFGSLFMPPWQAVVFYGVAANVCYSLGPALEWLITKVWGREVLPTGPALFRMGLTFSLGLTMLPALAASLLWAVRMIAWVVGLPT